MTIGDVAAACAYAAVATLLISAVALALFFGGAGDFWGPVNDVFIALTLLLLLPVMLALLRLAPDDIGPWFAIVTIAAGLGVLLAAVGQVVLVLGGISLQTSFVTGGVGVMPIVAWMIGLAVLVFTRDMLSVTVGWLLVALLASVVVTTIASFGPWPVTAAGAVLLTGLLCGWLLAIAGDLRAAI